MKKLLTLFAALFCCLCVSAQDIIITKDAKRIDAKILEINTDDVKYKDFNNLGGPIYTILKCNISSLIYSNGKIETFPECEQKEEPKTAQKNSLIGTVWKNDHYLNPFKLFFITDFVAKITGYMPTFGSMQSFDCTYTIDENGCGVISIDEVYTNDCDFDVNENVLTIKRFRGHNHTLKRIYGD